jgi:hypothetical protein
MFVLPKPPRTHQWVFARFTPVEVRAAADDPNAKSEFIGSRQLILRSP